MTIDLPLIIKYIGPFVDQIEGPYKWYIMGGVAFLLTAFITRFIFKTFKWFLLLLCIVVLMVGAFYFLANLATPLHTQEELVNSYLPEEN